MYELFFIKERKNAPQVIKLLSIFEEKEQTFTNFLVGYTFYEHFVIPKYRISQTFTNLFMKHLICEVKYENVFLKKFFVILFIN